MNTTDTDALKERIAYALGKENYTYGQEAQALFRDDATAVLPIVAEEMRAAQVAALRQAAADIDRSDHNLPGMTVSDAVRSLRFRADDIETGDSDEHR